MKKHHFEVIALALVLGVPMVLITLMSMSWLYYAVFGYE